MTGGLVEGQATGEGFDLLPLASRDIHVQTMAGRVQASIGQLAQSGQLRGASGQLCEGRWRRQLFGILLDGFGLFQGALAQPGGEFRVLGLPVQMQLSEGARAP